MKNKLPQVPWVLLAAAVLLWCGALNIWYYTTIFGSNFPDIVKFFLL